MRESDFPRLFITGYGSSPSRCRPCRSVATDQTWDLPVPVQRASTHARFFDHAGPSGHSRLCARLCCLPPSQERRHPGYESLRGSMAGLWAPLPTLRCRPHGRHRTAQGQCGSLLLHCVGLTPTTRCRSPGALRKILDTTVDRRMRTIGFGTIAPATAALQHMDDAANHATIVLSFLA